VGINRWRSTSSPTSRPPLRLLVNCAGVMCGQWRRTEEGEIEESALVNAVGPARLAAALVPALLGRRNGGGGVGGGGGEGGGGSGGESRCGGKGESLGAAAVPPGWQDIWGGESDGESEDEGAGVGDGGSWVLGGAGGVFGNIAAAAATAVPPWGDEDHEDGGEVDSDLPPPHLRMVTVGSFTHRAVTRKELRRWAVAIGPTGTGYPEYNGPPRHPLSPASAYACSKAGPNTIKSILRLS